VLSSRPNPDGGIAYQTRFFGDFVGELGGSYQEKNANTVLTAVMQLYNKGVIKNAESIAKGFANVCELTGLMGRWQKLQANPLVICDTGHNVGGWTYLSQQIKRQQCKQKRIVFGMVDDKDLHAVMSMLPDDAIYYWTQPSTHRAFPAEKVAETANDYDLHGKVFPTVLDAYQAALHDAAQSDFIFVGGSSYVVADLLTSLQKK
jgi:tetrahydrofolate synthase